MMAPQTRGIEKWLDSGYILKVESQQDLLMAWGCGVEEEVTQG